MCARVCVAVDAEDRSISSDALRRSKEKEKEKGGQKGGKTKAAEVMRRRLVRQTEEIEILKAQLAEAETGKEGDYCRVRLAKGVSIVE